MDLGVKSMSFTSSSASWKSTDVVASQFPAGLRVLVVDDDPTCLRILGKMLSNCQYEVTTCNQAVVALDFLRENKNGCDIVISDVHMPDMDGFKLLEHIGLEMDLPVIMMSADDSKDVVMKGVTHGACDYLIKPVRIEALKTIWQHVVRRKKHEWKEKDLEHSGSVGEVERHEKPLEDVDCSSSVNEGSWKNSKKRKDEEDEAEDRDDTSSLKKPRVVWSIELHQQFVTAVNQLGIDKAVPKKILEIMNVPGLTRENVASHLQKYRIYLRRLSGVSHHQNSFMGSSDSPFGPISALNAVDLQALAASGQLPHQSLASIQAASFGRSTLKSAVPSPLVEPRNVFDFENPKLRFVEGQQQQNGNSKHMSTDSKHLVNMNLHGQSNPLLMQMVQPTTVLVHNGIENICDGPQYTSLSQPSTSASFSSQRSRGFPGNYDVSNDLIQNRTQDWRFGSTYVPPQLPNIRVVDASPSTNKAAFSASDKPSRNKSERLPEMGLNNGLLSGRFGQEDLMSVLLKQQQGMEGDDSDLGFGGFPLDNLPV